MISFSPGRIFIVINAYLKPNTKQNPRYHPHCKLKAASLFVVTTKYLTRTTNIPTSNQIQFMFNISALECSSKKIFIMLFFQPTKSSLSIYDKLNPSLFHRICNIKINIHMVTQKTCIVKQILYSLNFLQINGYYSRIC